MSHNWKSLMGHTCTTVLGGVKRDWWRGQVPGILDDLGAFRPFGAKSAPQRHFVMDLRGPTGLVRSSVAGAIPSTPPAATRAQPPP